MNMTPGDPPDQPPGSDDEPHDEAIADLDDLDELCGDEDLEADNAMDVREFIGEYPGGVADYFKAILEALMDPSIVWILEHLDYRAIQAKCEADGSRFFQEGSAVYVTYNKWV